ncbi:MAG: hypothetical protein JSV87_01740 [Candidatus Bathyarchaeota archaeon]|nr:MAG: hypothetical protein JSV87_01740 [Candidatus Bathyarchaeota archaeon]
MEMEEIARWAYIIFLVIAIIAGLAIGYMAFDARAQGGFEAQTVADMHGYVLLIMLVLGIIIGIAGSITAKEIAPFLIATIALMVAGSGEVWSPLQAVEALEILYYLAAAITSYIAAFAAPAAVIIAIKGVLAMAKEK